MLLAGEHGKKHCRRHFWFDGRKPLILMTGGVSVGAATAKGAMKNTLSSLIIVLALLGGIDMARSATLAWTNTAGGNWSVAANWDPNQVPGSNDTAQINSAAGTYTVTVDVNATVNSLVVGGAVSGVQNLQVPNGVTLTMSSATVNTNGTVTVAGGGEMDLLQFILYGPLTNSGTINLNDNGYFDSIYIYNDGVNYYGGVVNQAGGQINLYAGGGYYAYIGVNGSGGQDYFINDGGLTVSGGQGAAINISDFDNTSGTVTNLTFPWLTVNYFPFNFYYR